MKLRKRTRQQRAAMVEAPGSGSEASDDEWSPIQTLSTPATTRRPKNTPQRRQKKAPELIETVLETIGRADLFDAQTLRCIRLVSKRLRDVVNATDALSSATFYTRTGVETLENWSAGGEAIQRTKSLFINGKVPAVLAGQLLLTMASEKPPISKLVLNSVSETGEALLAVQLSELRDLTVTKMSKTCDTMQRMIKNPSFVGLRLLTVTGGRVEAAALSAALAHFPDLQSLSLLDMCIDRDLADPETLQGSLDSLETLKLSSHFAYSPNHHLGLLSTEGPELPALRSLHVGRGVVLSSCPCLGQLTELGLSDGVRVTSIAVSAALHGGPLERLSLSGNLAYDNWDWENLHLPQLQSISVCCLSANVLGDVATAHLPALRSAALSFGQQTTTDGIQAFSAAFPEVSELTLWSHPSDEAVAVFKALKTALVPQLESLTWISHESSPLEAARHFLPKPVGPSGTVRWPRLRSFSFHLQAMGSDTDQKKLFTKLARAASQCPNLTSLKAEVWYRASAVAVEAFVAKAGEVGAWPELRELGVNFGGNERARMLRTLQGAWREATVECTSSGVDRPY